VHACLCMCFTKILSFVTFDSEINISFMSVHYLVKEGVLMIYQHTA
jgi:hypothetical protein